MSAFESDITIGSGDAGVTPRPALTIDLTRDDLRPALAAGRPLAQRLQEPVQPGSSTAWHGETVRSGSTSGPRVAGPTVHPLVPAVVELLAVALTAVTIGMVWREIGGSDLLPILAVIGLVAAPAWWIGPWARSSRRGVLRTEIVLLVVTISVGAVFFAVSQEVIPGMTHQATALVLAIVGLRAAGLLAASALAKARFLAGRRSALVLSLGRLAGPAAGLGAISLARFLRAVLDRDQLLACVASAEGLAALVLLAWLVVHARIRRRPVIVPPAPEDPDEGLRHRPPYWSGPGTVVRESFRT